MKKILAIGNETGITKVTCRDCGSIMERMDGGYSEKFTGEYDQVDYPDYFKCECGRTEDV